MLGGFELAIGVGQALPQPLHGLSVVIVRHASTSEHSTPPQALSGRLITFPGRALLCSILYTNFVERRFQEVR